MAYNPNINVGPLDGNTANNSLAHAVTAVAVGPGYSLRYDPAALGTAANSASTIDVDGAASVTISVSTTTTGTFVIEGTADNTNWVFPEVFDAAADLWVSGTSITPTAGKVYQVISQGFRQLRIRTNATLGATVTHNFTLNAAQSFLGGMDTGPAPHNFGYNHFNRAAEYTTVQTGAAIFAPTAGKRFAVSSLTISVGGTTAGIVTVWQGSSADTTYTAGTDPAIFRGEFAPSATVRPGVVKTFPVPFVSSTADHQIRVTTSAGMTLYVQISGYEF